MPSDTYDPFLGLILQGAGNNNNTWGDKLNDSAIKMAARGIAGVVSRGLTGGTLDLSGSPPPTTTRQDIDHIQVITGTLSSIQTIIVPSLAKTWLFYNNTTGVLYVKTTGAVLAQTAHVPARTAKLLWCDGTQVRRLDAAEIGTIVLLPTAYNGPGWVLCNGQSLLIVNYPNLYDVIGTNYGSGAGSFNVPSMGTFASIIPTISYWIKY